MNHQIKVAIRTCPLCGRTDRSRMMRARKWKLLFMVRSYSCRNCHSQYMVLFGLFSLLVERGFSRFS